MIKTKKNHLCLITGVFCNQALFEETLLYLDKNIISSIHTIDDAQSFSDAAAELDRTIDTPSFILGFSFGGLVAQEFAYRYPHKTQGLILLSTAKDSVSEETKKAMILACRQLEKTPSSDFINGLIDSYFDSTIDKEVILKFTDMANAVDTSSAVNQYRLIIEQTKPVGGSCSNLPIVILHGESDKRIRSDDQIKIRNHYPHAEFVSMPKVGHFIPLEQPKGLANVINTFMAENT